MIKLTDEERLEGREEGIEIGMEKGIEKSIKIFIETFRELNLADNDIINKLIAKFSLTLDQANKYLK